MGHPSTAWHTQYRHEAERAWQRQLPSTLSPATIRQEAHQLQWPAQQPEDRFLSAAPDAELPPLPSRALELPPSRLLPQWQSRQENPQFQQADDWQWHQAQPLQQLPSHDAALTGLPTPQVPALSSAPAGSHDGLFLARPQYSESFNLLSGTSGAMSPFAPAAGCWPDSAGDIDLARQQPHYQPYQQQQQQQAQHDRDLQQGRRSLEDNQSFLDVDCVYMVLPDASKPQAGSAEVWALLDAPQPPQRPIPPAATAAIVAAGRDFLRNSSSSNSSAGTPPWLSHQDGPLLGAQACKPVPAPPLSVGKVQASTPAAPPAAVHALLAEQQSLPPQLPLMPSSCAAVAPAHEEQRLSASPAAAPCLALQPLAGARVRSESGGFRSQDAATPPAGSPSRDGAAGAAAAVDQPVTAQAPAAPSTLRGSVPAGGAPVAAAPPEDEVRPGEAAGAAPRAQVTPAWAEAKPESKTERRHRMLLEKNRRCQLLLAWLRFRNACRTELVSP